MTLQIKGGGPSKAAGEYKQVTIIHDDRQLAFYRWLKNINNVPECRRLLIDLCCLLLFYKSSPVYF